MRCTKRWAIPPALIAVLVAGAVPALSDEPALAPGVYFENDGRLTGWDRSYAQKDGVIRNVGSPKYKGSSAIEAKQTYINETGGYHSEVIKRRAQSVGQDRYYGQAIYLPASWKFHNQNITFQQWSPEDPEGPWLLMFIQGSMRWSSGIYCTAWRDGKPSGQRTVSIFHDNHRIASTYALAEPANW